MANHETVNSVEENIRKELYFLIAKYLSNGPCQRAAQVLKDELYENRLLPDRLDWMGRERPQNFQETSNLNRHISDDFLEKICKRLVPLLENQIPASVKGVQSLLGAGRQSLLRKNSDRIRTSISLLTVCHHGAPLLPPGRGIQSANIAQVLCSREACGTSSKRNMAQPNLYAKQSMHRRILGHLSAVYCVLFDRTGQCIITGADDSLVKIWSSEDGRLLATLRGHQLEISDIAINYENTLVAAGSCDKVIRVWSLKTLSPIAVLQGHTGMITSLQFCPSPLNEARYLMSTGGDGTVCFWKWDISNSTFETNPIRFIEKSRPGTQMVCSSFSPGGTFLVTGSTDHIIRIYQMTPGPPERIAELDAHTDHVDSIQFSHGGDRFLSGSRDGTSRIWFFRRSQWKNLLLDISRRPPGSLPLDEALKALKLKVTMVGWDLWDQHVITAVNNHTLKVWEATTGNLVHVLEGHSDEVFVLEAHPTDPHFFLSAGHDGCVILWDLRNGNIVTKFHNTLEGQGHGAVFDCKFSPDALTFACTDSHGHLCIFGYGSSAPYMKVPSEQFFHTDYRPLIRDSNNHVLDEQTQMLPHLMPPPFLVDVDGNPHPLHYQRLVPGHSSNVRTPSRTRNAEQQSIPPLLAEIEAAEARERMVGLRSPPPQGGDPPQFPQPPLQSPSGTRNYGMRQSGDVEGVRLAHGNVPVIQDVSEADITAWRNRRIVPDMKPSMAKYDEEKRLILGREEIMLYLREKKRRALPSTSMRRQEPACQVPKPARTARRVANRTSGSSSRSNQRASSGRYSTRAAAALDIDESAEEEAMATPSESEDDEEWSESSSSESSEYSDWTEEVGLRVQRQTEDRRSRRVRRLVSTSDEGEGSRPSSPQRQPKPKKESKPKKKPVKKKKVPKKAGPDQIQETLEYYQPPDWLMCTRPRLSPYVPQIGDEVYYLRQGHEMYVKEVVATKVYEINPKKQCFYKLNLKSEELCRIVSLHYSVGPPTLCCLKLALINPEMGNSTGASFTVKYHDMPDVLDFLILRQFYDNSITRNWQPGDRFRAVIDDSWWAGMITDKNPYEPEHQDSFFQCFTVHWDTGEVERMSPWDLQPLAENDTSNEEVDVSGAGTSDIPLTNEDRQAMSYTPDDSEWFNEGREEMIQRVMAGIEAVCLLRFAGLFVWPVDVQAYPDYWTIVAFPTDLNTIKERLENKFYRRSNALLWEIRQLERNALLFNEEESQVVKDAQKLCGILSNFIKDSTCTDILRLVPEDEAENGEVEVDEPSQDGDQEDDTQESSSNGKRKRTSNQSGTSTKRVKHEEPEEPQEEPWLRAARELLEFLFQREDAEPFRYPVNLEEFPDYLESVSEPMDFSTIFDRLESGFYVGPEEFVHNVRLIFSNSRAYNTVPRSRIYGMTIRLSAMFEDRVDTVFRDWYETASGGARRTRLRTQQLLQSRPGPSGLAGQRSQHRTTGASTEAPSTNVTSRTQGVPPIIIARQPRSLSVSSRTSESEASESYSRSVVTRMSNGSIESGPETRTNRRTTAPTYTIVTSQNRGSFASDNSTDVITARSTRSSARQELSRRFSARSSVSDASDLNNSQSTAYGTRYATRRQTLLARNAMEEEDEGETEEEYVENGEASSDEDGQEEEEDEEEEEGEEENGIEEESEEEEDDEEEEESSEEEDSRRKSRRLTKPTHRPTVQRKIATNSSSRKQQQSNNSRSRRTSDVSVVSSRSAGSSSRPVRNLRSSRAGTRHVTYAESDSDSDQERTLGISSRGRVRRPTMRMIDYVD